MGARRRGGSRGWKENSRGPRTEKIESTYSTKLAMFVGQHDKTFSETSSISVLLLYEAKT